jgi:mRNA interferase MazF
VVTYQWGVFWADLNPNKGSERAGRRPVLVISAEEANISLPVISVLPLTSIKSGRKVYPIEVYLTSEESGLPKDSIAMAHQIRALTKERLGEKSGQIVSEETKGRIRKALKIYLDLEWM